MPVPIASLPPATERIPFDPGPDERIIDAPSVKFSELSADKQAFSFFDFLDIINPLQHIPVVSAIYRSVTGDEIGLAARIIGGGLFGGPFGLFNAALSAAVEEASGKEPANHILEALLNFEGPAKAPDGKPGPELAASPDPKTRPPQPADAPAAPPPTGAGAPQPHAAAAAAPSVPPPAVQRSGHFVRAAPFAPPPPVPGASPSGRVSAAELQDIAPAAGPASRAAAERARIARKVLEAQRAQMSLLLANGAEDRRAQDERPEKAREAAAPGERGRAPEHPFRRHPNMMPPGASSQWIRSAMENALDKYQQTLRLRGTGLALPLPGR